MGMGRLRKSEKGARVRKRNAGRLGIARKVSHVGTGIPRKFFLLLKRM